MMSIDDVISRLSDLDTEDSSASSDEDSDAALMCEGTSCSSTEGHVFSPLLETSQNSF